MAKDLWNNFKTTNHITTFYCNNIKDFLSMRMLSPKLWHIRKPACYPYRSSRMWKVSSRWQDLLCVSITMVSLFLRFVTPCAKCVAIRYRVYTVTWLGHWGSSLRATAGIPGILFPGNSVQICQEAKEQHMPLLHRHPAGERPKTDLNARSGNDGYGVSGTTHWFHLLVPL